MSILIGSKNQISTFHPIGHIKDLGHKSTNAFATSVYYLGEKDKRELVLISNGAAV